MHARSPIVISVPHDGTERIPGALIRTEVRRWIEGGGPDPRDEATFAVAEAVRRNLHDLGSSAHVLMTRLHRCHVDVNRSPDQEPFVDGCGAYYLEYHEALARMVASAMQEYDRCLLIDLHGFLRPPGAGEYDIVLGTDEHATAPHGSDRIFAKVCAEEYHTVFSPDPERGVTARYRGGWIVRSVAQRWKHRRVDAIQVELAAHLRLGTPHDRIADTLSQAMCLAAARL